MAHPHGKLVPADAVPASVMLPEDAIIRLSPLGTGNFSSVYLAQTRRGGTFVIKHTLRRALERRPPTQNPNLINGVPAEAVVLTVMPRHENIVRYLSMAATDDAYLVFFQHCPDATTLTQLIEGTADWCRYVTGYVRDHQTGRVLGLQDQFACALARQLFAAVAHCHTHGVAHRDIKTENVLVSWTDAGFRVLLIDFGFATWCGDGTPASCTFPGTEHFAAPELMAATPYDPRRSDVWACGVVLYAMLLARVPFGGPTREQLAREICTVDPPFRRALCASVIILLRSMLAKDAAARPTIVEAYNDPWLAARATVAPTATLPPPALRTPYVGAVTS